jgi:hypothetical protein
MGYFGHMRPAYSVNPRSKFNGDPFSSFGDGTFEYALPLYYAFILIIPCKERVMRIRAFESMKLWIGDIFVGCVSR